MKKILDWLVFIVCASLPLYVVRFKIFEIPATLLEILILILFLIWFFERGIRVKNWFKFVNLGEFTLPVIFLALTAVISTGVSFDQNGGLGILKAYFLEPVLLFLVVFERVRSGGGKYVLLGIVLGSIWLSILAIFQKFAGFGIPEYAKGEIAQGRVVGVYNSANALALFLGPVFSLVLGTIFSRSSFTKSFILEFIFSLTLFLQATALILTNSQGSIFAIGVISAFVILSKITSEQLLEKTFKLIVILAIFLMMFLPLLAFFGKNLGAVFVDKTLTNRFYLWQGTVALILDRPLTGAGLDGFKELYSAHYRLPAYDELLQYPHNLVLTFWTELGLLGVVIFFWFIFKFGQKSVGNKILGLGLMSAIIYLFIHGIVDVPYFKNDLSAQFFVLLALTEFRK